MTAVQNRIEFPYDVIRTSRRKTASIKVIEGNVQVVVPMDLPQDEIEGVLYKKRLWVREKIRMYEEAMPSKPKEYVNGEAFSYLGKNYKLKIVLDGIGEVKLKAGYLELHIREGYPESRLDAFIQRQLSSWYRRKAQKRLTDKVARLSATLDLKPRSVSVEDFKSRWGSCSVEGDISFNWKIIMAPHGIIDYVVAHELCHMIEHNHSPAFWRHVERIIPDYRDRKDWLKENGAQLTV